MWDISTKTGEGYRAALEWKNHIQQNIRARWWFCGELKSPDWKNTFWQVLWSSLNRNGLRCWRKNEEENHLQWWRTLSIHWCSRVLELLIRINYDCCARWKQWENSIFSFSFSPVVFRRPLESHYRPRVAAALAHAPALIKYFKK